MKIRSAPLALFVSGVLAAASAAAAGLDPAFFGIELTDLGAGVNPTAINNVGQVAGQASGQAFRWSGGTLTPLGTLGGAQSFANDLNDSGIVVGWSHDSEGKQKSFKWDGALINLDSSVTLQGSAEAINSNGEIVGWRTGGSQFRSVGWNDSNPDGELMFGSDNLKALGINDQGEIVGNSVDAGGFGMNGYYWNGADDTGSITHGLGVLYLPVAGINNGSVTAGNATSEASHMSVSDAVPTTIGTLSNSDPTSKALGLNDIGFIVGESASKGFVYEISTHTLANINIFPKLGFSPNTILRLTDINNANQFVGVALAGGIEHGILGQFTPRLPGDYDQDHDADADDLLAWQRAFGSAAAFPYAGADGDGSGTIDAADYTLWRDNLGTPPLSAAVPEPAARVFALGLVAAACLIRRVSPRRGLRGDRA